MWYLPFTAWLISLSLMLSSSIHAVMKGRSSFFLLHSIPFCKCTVVFWSTYLWNFLRKLKMELPFDPAIPLLGSCPKNPETPIQKNLCTPMFIRAQFTIAKCWKQPKCPSVNEWIKKTIVHLQNGILCSRKKELLSFATAWMELESIMLSEISQAVKDKYHMISPVSGT